jgi:hypothetical protein
MSLFTVLGILILAGIISLVIKNAPFIDEPYKGYALLAIWVFVVLYLAWSFFGPFPDVRIPGRRG